MLDFILNASLFVLVGLQLRGVVNRLGTVPAGKLARYAIAVSAATILIRLVWFFTMPYLIRLLDRRPSQVARRVGARRGSCWRGPAHAARCRWRPRWRCP